MSLLEHHLDAMNVDPVDPNDCCSEQEYDERRDTALIEAVDGYVNSMALDDQVELLKENSHLKFLYEDPMIDLTSFDTIAATCAYNLLKQSWRARNS